MRVSLTRSIVALCGSACVMACADGQAGTGSRASLERSSWDVTLQVKITKQQVSNVNISCPSLSFTMHLEPQGSGLGVTWGANGQVIADGQLVRQPGGQYALAAPTSLPTNAACFIESPVITRVALTAMDTDGDGVVDQIAGSGVGKGGWLSGDVIYSLEFSFELIGIPDVMPPQLTLPEIVHPLEWVSALASEPLAPTSDLRLEGTTSVSLKPSTAAAGAVGAFVTDVVLPFSGSWTVTGVASDLIGLPLVQPLTLKTLADPGIFVDGGFEGGAPLVAVVIGDVNVVGALGTVPALGGGHSLFVPPGASVTFHLRRPPGTSSVRFNCRMATTTSGGYLGYRAIRIGVVGGLMRQFPMVPSNAAPTIATGDRDWPFVTPVVDVTEPLIDAADDIVLQISPWTCLGGLCAPSPAVLIDDVRVE